MSMYIHGTIEERGCEGIGCDECPYQSIKVDIEACILERGNSIVDTARDLWSLVDPERARKIGSWLEDEWSEDPDGDCDVHCYGPGSCRYLLNLIEGLSEGLQEGLDVDFTLRISSELAATIRSKHPFLVDSWTEDSGEVFTLANQVSNVGLLCGLLETALKHDRLICIG